MLNHYRNAVALALAPVLDLLPSSLAPPQVFTPVTVGATASFTSSSLAPQQVSRRHRASSRRHPERSEGPLYFALTLHAAFTLAVAIAFPISSSRRHLSAAKDPCILLLLACCIHTCRCYRNFPISSSRRHPERSEGPASLPK